MEDYRSEIDRHVLDTEHQIGYALPGVLDHRSVRHLACSFDARKLDLDDVVRRLHSYQTELIILCRVADFGKDLGNFLQNTAQELQDPLSVSANGHFSHYGDGLMHQIDFSTNACGHLMFQGLTLKERVQSHINLVSPITFR